MSVNIDLNGIFDLVDQLFTSDEERQEAKLKMLELQQKGELAQIAVNKTEAEHASIFVAGWRPFIGWVCGGAFAWHFLLLPIVSTICVVLGVPFVAPFFDMSSLMTVLGGMLGLGAMRTYEKQAGTARENMTETPKLDRRASAVRG